MLILIALYKKRPDIFIYFQSVIIKSSCDITYFSPHKLRFRFILEILVYFIFLYHKFPSFNIFPRLITIYICLTILSYFFFLFFHLIYYIFLVTFIFSFSSCQFRLSRIFTFNFFVLSRSTFSSCHAFTLIGCFKLPAVF